MIVIDFVLVRIYMILIGLCVIIFGVISPDYTFEILSKSLKDHP